MSNSMNHENNFLIVSERMGRVTTTKEADGQ